MHSEGPQVLSVDRHDHFLFKLDEKKVTFYKSKKVESSYNRIHSLPRSRQNVLNGGNFGRRAKQLTNEFCAIAYFTKIRRDEVRNIKFTAGTIG